MKGERNTDRNVRKYITISDTEMWDTIDKIMTLPRYQKSFNKVINDALFYGLDELHNRLFEKAEVIGNEEISAKDEVRFDGANGKFFYEVMELLQEVILNITINKSILSSLFKVAELESQNKKVLYDKLANGHYRHTPDYLLDFEIRELKKMRR